MNRDFSLFIKDIHEAIDDIENFIADMNFDAFSSDRKTRIAVVHEIEIIGEAAKNIPIHQKKIQRVTVAGHGKNEG